MQTTVVINRWLQRLTLSQAELHVETLTYYRATKAAGMDSNAQSRLTPHTNRIGKSHKFALVLKSSGDTGAVEYDYAVGTETAAKVACSLLSTADLEYYERENLLQDLLKLLTVNTQYWLYTTEPYVTTEGKCLTMTPKLSIAPQRKWEMGEAPCNAKDIGVIIPLRSYHALIPQQYSSTQMLDHQYMALIATVNSIKAMLMQVDADRFDMFPPSLDQTLDALDTMFTSYKSWTGVAGNNMVHTLFQSLHKELVNSFLSQKTLQLEYRIASIEDQRRNSVTFISLPEFFSSGNLTTQMSLTEVQLHCLLIINTIFTVCVLWCKCSCLPSAASHCPSSCTAGDCNDCMGACDIACCCPITSCLRSNCCSSCCLPAVTNSR
jgi:hypothetical protein